MILKKMKDYCQINTINNYTIHGDQDVSKEKLIIDEIMGKLFAAFTNKGKTTIRLACIKELFIPVGIIIKNTGTGYEFYNLQQFIEPREKLLNNGTLVDFEEEELTEQTTIAGHIAQRISVYHKKGILSGNSFHTRGAKSIQFIKTPEGWKINSLIWDDERKGLDII